MAAAESGGQEKLTITQVTVQTDGSYSADGQEFSVMLNPSSYKHSRTIKYDRAEIIGQRGYEMKFAQYEGETINFTVLIDGTGAVPAPSGGAPQDVKTQLAALRAVVYDYDGQKHEPNVVQLLWGSLLFLARLTSLSVDYTLFKPSGEPLRAKVTLDFTSFMSKEEESLTTNRSSSDLSHSVEVKDGDTLPLLCYRIYKDSSRYQEVARFNNMSAFRKLEPGTRISFPPLTSDQNEASDDTGVRKYPRAAPLPPGRRTPSQSASA